jgi:hypothetical protein
MKTRVAVVLRLAAAMLDQSPSSRNTRSLPSGSGRTAERGSKSFEVDGLERCIIIFAFSSPMVPQRRSRTPLRHYAATEPAQMWFSGLAGKVVLRIYLCDSCLYQASRRNNLAGPHRPVPPFRTKGFMSWPLELFHATGSIISYSSADPSLSRGTDEPRVSHLAFPCQRSP